MPTREISSFNENWRFRRGPAPDEQGRLDYTALREWVLATGTDLISAGSEKPVRPKRDPLPLVSFARAGFDDGDWRRLDLPHDWGIEGPFSHELPGETGKLPWHGVGWYRKTFRVPERVGRRVELLVDGAMAFSAFWLNGRFVGGWPYGYSSFRLDLTRYLRFDDDNVLAVRLDNPANSSRWYPGGGIYRNVFLRTTAPVRVAHWGAKVTTQRLRQDRAWCNLDVVVENLAATQGKVTLHASICQRQRDGTPGPTVTTAPAQSFDLGPALGTRRTFGFTIDDPTPWNLVTRHRYLALTRVEHDGHVVDELATPFGVRTVGVDPDRGLLLNGERVELKGVCLHHDLGALGAAINHRALERQIEIMQNMGANAIRTSHNPPTPELLELCDEMGMLVMVEAFDCWRRGKKWSGKSEFDPDVTYFDYASVFDDWHERDLRAMVRRDQNHPSVVMWSIGNEVSEQWTPDGYELATRLAGIVREEDRSRPVTCAFNAEHASLTGFQTAVDILGYNYKPWAYAGVHEQNPTLPLLGAETSSCISSRGEYFFPVSDDKSQGRENFQVSSYDLSATSWAMPPDREFRGLDECPFVAGEFVWTGFDYLGEPTPYNSDHTNVLNFSDPAERERAARELEELGQIRVPSRSSYFGIVDLCGFPKDRFYLYRARWRPELREDHILPHWNWPEREGLTTPVHVYSAGDEAELFLNGRSLGRKRRARFEYRFRWDDVVYEPGELRVESYKAGAPWASSSRKTTGPACRLALEADRARLAADGRDLAFVTVSVTDAEGRTVPRAAVQAAFSVDGPGEVVAVDNGDPTSFESFQARERTTFNGLCLVVVRTTREAGAIQISAISEGLAPASLTLQSA